MTIIQQWEDQEASPDVIFNENMETVSAFALFAKKHADTSYLVWGYYGGYYDSTLIADGTVTLTNASANYVVMARATGVVSVSTATTNWTNTTDYGRLYKVTTAGGVVAVEEDHRFGAKGILTSTGVAGFTSPTTTKGDLIVRDVSADARLPVGTNTHVLTADSAEPTGVKWAPAAVGSGDVVGPGSATDGALAAFDGTTGKLIKVAATATIAQGGTGQTTLAGLKAALGIAVQVLTDGATINVDASLGDNCRVTLGGNRTLANPTNLIDGQVLNFRIIQDGTGSRTLAYGSNYKFPGGTAPVLTTTANAKDFMSCQWDATGGTLFCVMSKDMK